MKTCSVKGNVFEYKTDQDVFLGIAELMKTGKVTPAEGVQAHTMYCQGWKTVTVDGSPFFEISETPDA
jgi:hypothetical protein